VHEIKTTKVYYLFVSLCDHLFLLLLPPTSNRYIAVDGTSLTVCEVNRTEGWFTFMLIAYTQKHIIVPHKAVGDRYEFVLSFC